MPFDTGATPDVLISYCTRHGAALFKAATLLGGESAGRRVANLLLQIADAPLDRHGIEEMHWLHQLLTLRIDSPTLEAAVSALHPDSACVTRICLLADGLEQALRTAPLS